MGQSKHRNCNWTPQRILIAAWAVDLTAVLVALAHPVSIGILRLLVAASVPFLWLLGAFLVRRKRALAATFVVLGVLVIVFSALPGRTVDPADLRIEYVRQLKRYNGTRYVWGGENGRGIDCSGLVRRALINAHMRIAFSTANPAAFRSALDLWWHDCSALAMRDKYRDLTAPVCKAESINSIANPLLCPGDLAVTASGIHVLAYLGNGEWIQAEPGVMKVITLTVPDENGWMKQPVHIMRWTQMKTSANQLLHRAQ